VAELTIEVDDIDRFVIDPNHQATITGFVMSDPLGGRLPVERGTFNLFVDDGDPTRKEMKYQLEFFDGAGRALTLAGTKVVRDGDVWRLLRDTTTLFTRIYQGHASQNAEGDAVGSGIIRIQLGDFLKQIASFRAAGPHAASALGRFMRLFSSKLWDVYGRKALVYGPV
jgi:cholesterol oxidase